MSSLSLLSRGPAQGFAADRRFAFSHGAPEVTEVDADPLNEAYEQGRADGYAEALALAEARGAEADAARGAIELALVKMDEQCAAELREKLRQTVLLLCEEAVAPLAIDPVGLCRRIERAVAMLQRKRDEALVRLHPEDLVLLAERLPAGLPVEPDATLERGALRIETTDGGIEDGPHRWRAILAEALRAC